jgi:hypothetical protein
MKIKRDCIVLVNDERDIPCKMSTIPFKINPSTKEEGEFSLSRSEEREERPAEQSEGSC